jgi:hypothetical protein
MKSRIIKFIYKYNLAIGTLLVFIVYLLPRVILGKDSFVTINDNLDSEIIWRVVLAKSGLAFKFSGNIEQIMNGIPREFLVSGYNLATGIYLIFEPFIAYVINEILVHLVAFLGMYFLLKEHILKKEKEILIIWGVSLCFSFIPFLSIYGLSVAGQPLLFYAFLNILKQKSRLRDFVIIFIFALYSSLVLSGFFIILSLIMVFIVHSILFKKINKKFLLGLLILVIVYLFVEFSLLKVILHHNGLISHRVERNVFFTEVAFRKCDNFLQAVFKVLENFSFGHRYSPSLHFPILFTLFLACIIIMKKIQKKNVISK